MGGLWGLRPNCFAAESTYSGLDSPSTQECCGVDMHLCTLLKVARTGDPSTTEGTIVEEVDRFCRLCEGGG